MQMAGDNKLLIEAQGVAITAEFQATAKPPRRGPDSFDKLARRIMLQPAGKLFSPAGTLVWVIGLLGAVACITPWIARGWVWFVLIATSAALLAGYDALTLWFTRDECAPILLRPEKGLRGREGQSILIPIALTSSGRHPLRSTVRVAAMPATAESETAIRVNSAPQQLKLEQPERAAGESM